MIMMSLIGGKPFIYIASSLTSPYELGINITYWQWWRRSQRTESWWGQLIYVSVMWAAPSSSCFFLYFLNLIGLWGRLDALPAPYYDFQIIYPFFSSHPLKHARTHAHTHKMTEQQTTKYLWNTHIIRLLLLITPSYSRGPRSHNPFIHWIF